MISLKDKICLNALDIQTQTYIPTYLVSGHSFAAENTGLAGISLLEDSAIPMRR